MTQSHVIHATNDNKVSKIRVDSLMNWIHKTSFTVKKNRKPVLFGVQIDGKEAGVFEALLPEEWDLDQCEFWANDGSWCFDNLLDGDNEVQTVLIDQEMLKEFQSILDTSLVLNEDENICSGLCLRAEARVIVM